MEEGSLNLNRGVTQKGYYAMFLQVIELPGGYKVLVLSTTPIQELPVDWITIGDK